MKNNRKNRKKLANSLIKLLGKRPNNKQSKCFVNWKNNSQKVIINWKKGLSIMLDDQYRHTWDDFVIKGEFKYPVEGPIFINSTGGEM